MAKARRLRVIVEADGGARGNPGPAGYGALVREAATGEVLLELGQSLGVATNNVAEYNGLIAGLRAAADLGAVDVEVRMDSRLVVEQMAGRWQIKHPGLRPLAAQAASLVARFETVRFVWVPREQNRAADALANAAMDGKLDDVASQIEPTPAATWAPRADAGAARLVLVRHGRTVMTAQRRYSGRGDVDLSPEGEAEARAVAARLRLLVGADGAAVVSSPLTRCRRTAQAIADALGRDVEVDEAFVECDFGAWEGLTFADVKKGWPDELAAWLADIHVAPPGGESFAAVADRVRPAVQRLAAAYPGAAVVVVSHVTPIKLVLRDVLGASDTLLHRLFLDAAGISIVDIWPDGGIAVRTINDTAHLTASTG
jgi:probable phosphoglycerate mutase